MRLNRKTRRSPSKLRKLARIQIKNLRGRGPLLIRATIIPYGIAVETMRLLDLGLRTCRMTDEERAAYMLRLRGHGKTDSLTSILPAPLDESYRSV